MLIFQHSNILCGHREQKQGPAPARETITAWGNPSSWIPALSMKCLWFH